MKEYSVVAVLWQDHLYAHRSKLPEDPDDVLMPTLSVGLLMDETDSVVVIASEIERYEDTDEVSYTVIMKNAICGKPKQFGTIKIQPPRK